MKYIDIEKHLKDRGIDLRKTHLIIDNYNNYAVFLLYNLSGKLIGYQNYNPNGKKSINYSKSKLKDMSTEEMFSLMKYFTYVSEMDKTHQIAVWGLETLEITSKYLFITEGIFDIIKIHNQGFAGIAVLGNDPIKLKGWLSLLPQKKIVIYDNDKAGKELRKLGNWSYTVPKPYKDLGEMSDDEVYKFLVKMKIIN